MAPRRRSSRLRSATLGKFEKHLSNNLGSLIEGDETLESASTTKMNSFCSPVPQTPVTASRIQPSPEEMHPSKVHQSTTQEPDSGLRLGFTDIKASGNNQPSGISQRTPSKIVVSDFQSEIKFASPGAQLGPVAQQMVDELHQKASQNKAKLSAEEETKKWLDIKDSSDSRHKRKLAHPKGKAGRFSDIHMAEFRKMDSIMSHPSLLRVQPAQASSTRENLKRSSRKAQLDEFETDFKKDSGLNGNKGGDSPARLGQNLPSKRFRKHASDDVSTSRPVSTHSQSESALKSMRPPSKIRSVIYTPNRTSLARSSVKKSVSYIPRLSKSPSKSTLHTASWGLAKFGPIRTSSRIPVSSKITKTPVKLECTKTTVKFLDSGSKFTQNPSTPFRAGNLKLSKPVNFTPKTVQKNTTTTLTSPSPMKSGISQPDSSMNLSAQLKKSESPTVKPNASRILFPPTNPIRDAGAPRLVEYPSLSAVHPLLQHSTSAASRSHSPSSPARSFTFQIDQPIKFNTQLKTSKPLSEQAFTQQTSKEAKFGAPRSFSLNAGVKDLLLPSVPHGMSNKRRRRPDSDEENEDIIRSTKKNMSNIAGISTPKPLAENKNPNTNTSSPKKRAFISLSRLNMLARPKTRK